jgi:hypothetical protein
MASLLGVFIFFPVKENEPKENALPRLFLRVTTSDGARGNSPAFRRGQTVRALIPPAASMLGAGQMGKT